MDSSPYSSTALARSAKQRKQSLKEKMVELEKMSFAMVEEQGLLNHSQAALILDVTPARVTELVNLGKLSRFDFLGRTYVSVREVKVRRQEDVKAGRPKRGMIMRLTVGVKAALKTDSLQKVQGGFAGPYEKAKDKARRLK